MGKMSELALCVGELRSAAQSLNSVADNLTALFGGKQSETSAQPELKPPAPKPLTLEAVRAVLAEKSRSACSLTLARLKLIQNPNIIITVAKYKPNFLVRFDIL